MEEIENKNDQSWRFHTVGGKEAPSSWSWSSVKKKTMLGAGVAIMLLDTSVARRDSPVILVNL